MTHAEAAKKYTRARYAYRNRHIDDDEFLKAREEWMEDQRKFDEERGESPSNDTE